MHINSLRLTSLFSAEGSVMLCVHYRIKIAIIIFVYLLLLFFYTPTPSKMAEKDKKPPPNFHENLNTRIVESMSWKFTQGNVLDYGCGLGKTGFTFILPKVEATDSQLYSTDISSTMIESAAKNFPHPRIQYKTGTFPDTFPFPEVKFDRIITLGVFHFLRDIYPTFNSLLGLLKPGGQLAISATTINAVAMKMVIKLVDHPVWGPYMAEMKDTIPEWSDYKNEDPIEFYRKVFFDAVGTKELLIDFKEIKAEQNFERFIDGCFMMNPCISKIPEDKVPALRDYYRQEVAILYGVPKDSPTIPYSTEFVCAVMEKP